MVEVANRPKNCIICDGPTGSREHVFPSALGGRREDKKIYCKNHNEWMGSHVGVLQRQLEAINAMLEVQPDRGTVKSHIFEAEKGERYAIKGANIAPAPDLDAILDSYTLNEPQQLRIAPSDLPRLKERAKQRGLKLDVLDKATPAVEFRVGPYTIPLMQGGDDAMRAVAYLALTFVAHFWPHVARAPGLAAIKDMLRSGSLYAGADSIGVPLPASEFMAWSPAIDEPPEVIHPTGLGHTIIICVRAGQVLAYLSLLDLQCWMIRLGDAAPDTADRTVVVHVDPLKTRYGDDWTINKFDHALIDGCVDQDYLGKAVLESGQMQQQITAVIGRVIDRRDRLEAESAKHEFDAAHRLLSPEREAAIGDFVALRRQRLVNHISMFAQHGNEATQMGALVRLGAIKATQPDPTSTDGLNDAARRVLNHVAAEITNTLSKVPPGYVLDPEFYQLLFGDMAQALIAGALAEELHR
ncbi:hypothetical protein [Stenotrophomonas sp. GD03937]|uniref:hypothetical protein n=1 Tax=Stenotrophomonas sp. GD03937 TaxID=2975408 RepID=UPI00244D7B6F|nr:hypothetical protein [Stenotrophomonas sp. GD03937]MDH1274130.1 HNH endonuclease [Stenotrophomonas sp. GD03937]